MNTTTTVVTVVLYRIALAWRTFGAGACVPSPFGAWSDYFWGEGWYEDLGDTRTILYAYTTLNAVVCLRYAALTLSYAYATLASKRDLAPVRPEADPRVRALVHHLLAVLLVRRPELLNIYYRALMLNGL